MIKKEGIFQQKKSFIQLKLLSILLLAFSCTCVVQAAGTAPTTRTVFGGLWGGGITNGDYTYMLSGGVINVWNTQNLAEPVAVGNTSSQPVLGKFLAAKIHNGHLYATWYSYDSQAGIAVFSLSNPANPTLVGNVTDYSTSLYRDPRDIVIDGDYLYVLDTQTGIYVADISTNVVPTFTHGLDTYGSYNNAYVNGNYIYAESSGFLGTAVSIFDISNPLVPTEVSNVTMPDDTIEIKFQDNIAYGFGTNLTIVDLTTPATPVTRSGITSSGRTGIVNGNTVYAIGHENIMVFDVTDLDAPVLNNSSVLRKNFAVRSSFAIPGGFVALDERDMAVIFDTATALSPVQNAPLYLNGGTAAKDLHIMGNAVVFAQNSYGLSTASLPDMAHLGRVDANLPEQMSARAIEGMAVVEDKAYIASWGSGLIIADISDLSNPVELGQASIPFASTVAVSGDYAYIGTTTNGGAFHVYDVSNPATPTSVASLSTSKTFDIQLAGNYAFLADNQLFDGVGGMRIIDISNPAAPSITGHFLDCELATGVHVTADSNQALLACGDGQMKIIDTTDKALPVLVGTYEVSDGLFNQGKHVNRNGDTAYFAHGFGVDVVDISNPAAPQKQYVIPTGFPVNRVQIGPNGDIYLATLQSGVQKVKADLIFADGFEP